MEPSRSNKPHLRVIRSADEAGGEPGGDSEIPALVERARQGDSAAWGVLYQRFFAGLYRHIGYLTQDPVAAEDLTQDTFARALSALDGFDARSSFETWLHGVGVNVVRNHWRGSGRRARGHSRFARQLAVAPPRPGDPELSHARKQRAIALLEAVQDLPPKLREAYVLLELRGLARAEAAAQLRITPSNLSARASRARARVRDELVARGWIEPSGADRG